MDNLKSVLNSDSVKEQFANALKDNAQLFTASIIDLYSTDTELQKCNPADVVMEALKAAVLKLPISKSIGFAYIIAYNESKKINGNWEKNMAPHFQLGYKGLIQLAKRSGVYVAINADFVYEGEAVEKDRMTGNISISGTPESDKVVGYFAYFCEQNGFKKSIYRTIKEAEKHAEKYSKTYKYKVGPWKTEADKMHRKGVLRDLLASWGTLSIEMSGAMSTDIKDDSAIEAEFTEKTSITAAIEQQAGSKKGQSLADKATGKSTADEPKKAADKAQTMEEF
jgi:recombination protein RecT